VGKNLLNINNFVCGQDGIGSSGIRGLAVDWVGKNLLNINNFVCGQDGIVSSGIRGLAV
jgi:predicted nucleotide-binding protein (sugar kinase/HSP70/actin superfamily)